MIVLLLACVASPADTHGTAHSHDSGHTHDTAHDHDSGHPHDTADSHDTGHAHDTAPDTGDTDTDTGFVDTGDTDTTFRILATSGACDGHDCTWMVTTMGTMGAVSLDLALTGVEGGPTERHTAFTRRAYDSSRETKALYLGHVHDGEPQVSDITTFFDPGNAETAAALTVQLVVSDSAGALTDCVVYGHDVSVFAETCTNVR